MDKKAILQQFMLSYSGKSGCNSQEKTITPSTNAQEVTADEGYTCLSKVNVEPVTSAIDSNITAENIKKDVSILGVVGTLESGGSGEDLQSVIDNIIQGKAGTTNFDVTSNATQISRYKFEQCKNLINGNFPNATSIGDMAFSSCSNLTSVSLPNATSIGNNSFNNCIRLTSVSLPNVTKLAEMCFYRCLKLTRIDIPKVTSIGAQCFYECSSLSLFDFRGATAVPVLSSTNAFNDTPSDKKIVVPDSLYNSWKTATNWSSISGIIKASDYEATL